MTIDRFLSWVVERAQAAATDAESPSTEKPEPTPSPKPDPAIDAIKNVRADLTKYGTAIGVGSILVVGGSALATMDSMFPLPTDGGWYAVVAVFTAAVVGSVALTSSFFMAKRRILIDTMEFKYGQEPKAAPPGSVPARDGGLSKEERELVHRRLDELAHEEAALDASLVEARAERLERVAIIAAAQGQADVVSYARAEAKRVAGGLNAAIAQAALLVIERRSAGVYRSALTIWLAIIAALGTAGVFVVADWSKGEREQLEAWVACQKDFSGEDAAALRSEVCGRIDPSAPTPTPGRADSSSANSDDSPSPNTNPVTWLNECAALRKGSGVSDELRDRALAECAGLPAPTPTAEPS